MNTMRAAGSRWAATPVLQLGQALLGLLFLTSGLLKIGNYGALVDVLASKGIPVATAATAMVIVFEIAGGTALVVGWNARRAAAALAIFVIPATLFFHAFWSADGAAIANQLNHFLKNIGILGALLMVASSNPRV
jgi:putative oxidoreductase